MTELLRQFYTDVFYFVLVSPFDYLPLNLQMFPPFFSLQDSWLFHVSHTMHYDQAHQVIWRRKFVKLEIRGKQWVLFVALFLRICGDTCKIILQPANTKRDSLQMFIYPPIEFLLTFAATQPDKFWHQTFHCSGGKITSNSHHQQKSGSMLARSTPLETTPARASGPASFWWKPWGHDTSPSPGTKHCSTSEKGGQQTHN